MNRILVLKYGLGLCLVSLFIYRAVLPGWNFVHSDFANYYVSAKLVRTHQVDSIYHDSWFKRQAESMDASEAVKFAPFPPVTAFLMLPLTQVKIETANRIWMIFNLLLFIPAVFVIRKITNWSFIDTFLFITLSGLSLLNNIRFGQMYWLMTVGVLFSIWWIKENSTSLSGIILGLFTVIKYLPVVIIFGQVLSNNKRLVAFSLLTIGLLVLLQYYFFGSEVMSEYFGMTLLPHLNGHIANQDPFAFEFQSWESLLLNVFCKGSPYFSEPLINAPQLKGVFKWAIHGILFLPAAYLCFANRKTIDAKLKLVLFLALPSLGVFTVLPASATYHFILLLAPLVILLSDSNIHSHLRRIIFSLYVLIGFIPYQLFFGLGAKVFVFLAYPRLGLITILYFVVLYSIQFYPKTITE